MIHTGTSTIETERLLLRPFLLTDEEDTFVNWASNPKVQRDYGEPVYATRNEVLQLLTAWIEQYPNLDFYRWAIIEKRSHQNIGQIAFCRVYTDCRTAEIEYCIGEGFWGNGYAGEALNAVIAHTFTHTGFLKLEAFHRQINAKSGRVLEKSAMQVTDTVERFKRLGQTPHGEICYAISKTDD